MPEEASETTPTLTVERPINPVTMQGLGISPQDIEGYWERQNSAQHEAFQNGAKTYNLLRESDAAVTYLKLNEQATIPLEAPAHNPDDYVQMVADLMQKEEHQSKGGEIRAHLQGLALEAPRDRNYRLMAKVINLIVNGDLVQDTKLSGKLKEKFSTVFGKEAPKELVALGYAIDDAKESHPTPTVTPTPSPTSESTAGTVLRPITPPGIQN